MNNKQEMINQINAIVSFLPENERKLLPQKFIDFFNNNASCSPENVIDMSKPLNEQKLTDETMLMLYYINNYLKKINPPN